jgi:hypothetical protein
VRTFVGQKEFHLLDDREMHLRKRWFHYSPPATFSTRFRSPTGLLWREGHFEEVIEILHGIRLPGLRPAGLLNHPLTYLAVTHPDEDRLIIDGDARAEKALWNSLAPHGSC